MVYYLITPLCYLNSLWYVPILYFRRITNTWGVITCITVSKTRQKKLNSRPKKQNVKSFLIYFVLVSFFEVVTFFNLFWVESTSSGMNPGLVNPLPDSLVLYAYQYIVACCIEVWNITKCRFWPKLTEDKKTDSDKLDNRQRKCGLLQIKSRIELWKYRFGTTLFFCFISF